MICLDTSVLIWGVQRVAHTGHEHMIERTAAYLEKLSDDGAQVVVPAPVVMEYLTGFDEHERDVQLATLARDFFSPAFDVHCAAIAAELWHGTRNGGQVGRDGVPRECIKMDHAIVACAIAHRVEVLVTGDENEMARIANGRIKVSGVPQVASQQSLV